MPHPQLSESRELLSPLRLARLRRGRFREDKCMNSPYSPVPVVDASPRDSSDTASSVTSKTSRTRKKSSKRESPTVVWTPPLSSETSALSSDTDGRNATAAAWISCLEDSPAKTSQTPGSEPESAASVAASGKPCGTPWAWFDPDSSSLKTSQLSLLEDSMLSSPTLPRSGLMRRGTCFELPTWARRTDASECLSWPTPDTSPEAPNSGSNRTNGPKSLGLAAQAWPTPKASDIDRRDCPSERDRRSPFLPSMAILWSTPRSSDGEKGGPNQSFGAGGRPLPSQAAQWPTPTLKGDHNRKGASTSSGDGLATAVAQWPTPSAQTYGTNQGGAMGRTGPIQPSLETLSKTWPSPSARSGKGHSEAQVQRVLSGEQGERAAGACRLELSAALWPQPGRPAQETPLAGKPTSERVVLSPRFVEALMGFPDGFTDCEHSGMLKYQSWRLSHSSLLNRVLTEREL